MLINVCANLVEFSKRIGALEDGYERAGMSGSITIVSSDFWQ
jgi:hypothetical protein